MQAMNRNFDINKARQTRFIVLHQPLSQYVCGWVVISHYLLPANTIYNKQIMALRPLKVGISLHERR